MEYTLIMFVAALIGYTVGWLEAYFNEKNDQQDTKQD